jgi:hypothetical protein
MKFNKPLSLSAVLGAEPSAAQDKNHWMLSLQFGELPIAASITTSIRFTLTKFRPWLASQLPRDNP